MGTERNVSAIAFAAFVFAALSCAVAAPAAPPDSVSAGRPRGDPERGRKLYSNRCTPCHGADGRGGVRVTGNPTPDWRDAGRMADSTHDDAYLRDCITNGRPKSGMVSWKKQGLKAADIEHLIAYIRTFARGDDAKKHGTAKPSAERGAGKPDPGGGAGTSK